MFFFIILAPGLYILALLLRNIQIKVAYTQRSHDDVTYTMSDVTSGVTSRYWYTAGQVSDFSIETIFFS